MAAREFLYIVQESAFKTPATSPTLGTQAIYIRLDGSNAFTMRPKPIQVAVPYGGGKAINAFRVSDKTECKGTLKCLLYADQAAFLLGWGLTFINNAQTAPWTTTEPIGDLASCAVYHAIQRSDGTIKRRVYLGTKVVGVSIDCSADSQIATLSLELQASTPQGNQFDSSTDPNGTTFPAPADTSYPTDPYLFIHTAGYLSIASSRTQFDSVSIAVKNVIAAEWFENRYANIIRCFGRDTTLAANLYYKPSPDDRTVYESSASESVSLEFNNTAHTLTFTMNAQNVYTSLDDDLPIDGVYMQKLTASNQWDASAGSDFTIATT